jgi:hypothetical protein
MNSALTVDRFQFAFTATLLHLVGFAMDHNGQSRLLAEHQPVPPQS